MNTKNAAIILVLLIVVVGVLILGSKYKTQTNSQEFPERSQPDREIATDEPVDDISGTVLNGEPREYEGLAFPDNTLDTSDWETYQNEDFGFEVKYPKSDITVSDKRVAEMKEMYEFGFYLDWHLGRVDIKPKSSKNGMVIYVYEKDVDTTFNLYSETNKAKHDVIKNIPVNNTRFFFLTPHDDTQPDNLSRYQGVYFAGDDKRAYEIVLAGVAPDQRGEFQEILSTFKLVK